MEPEKDYNLTVGLRIREIREGFETDTILELLRSLDKESRESALKILREYVNIIRTVSGR